MEMIHDRDCGDENDSPWCRGNWRVMLCREGQPHPRMIDLPMLHPRIMVDLCEFEDGHIDSDEYEVVEVRRIGTGDDPCYAVAEYVRTITSREPMK